MFSMFLLFLLTFSVRFGRWPLELRNFTIFTNLSFLVRNGYWLQVNMKSDNVLQLQGDQKPSQLGSVCQGQVRVQSYIHVEICGRFPFGSAVEGDLS